jgi:hypothetical protein
MVEYILCYGGPAEHWGPVPATRLASRKIFVEQNIKKRTGPALCVLCGPTRILYIKVMKTLARGSAGPKKEKDTAITKK